MQWVWENSTARDASRMVLLAIADCASDDGGNAWPSVATLAQKANVSVRTVQRAIKTLAAQGVIDVGTQTGPNGVNRYRIVMAENAKPAQPKGVIPSPRQPVTPDICDERGVTSATVTPDICDENTAQMSPVTVLEPSIEPSVEPSVARTRVDTTQVITLAAYFTESVPISNPSRTRSVIAKALGAGVDPARIRKALSVLVEEGRGCTEDQLRIALQGARGSPHRSTTDQRAAQGLELAAKYAALEAAEQKAITP